MCLLCHSVTRVLEAINALPVCFPSREWMISELLSRNISKSIALWLGKLCIPAIAFSFAVSISYTGTNVTNSTLTDFPDKKCTWNFDRDIVRLCTYYSHISPVNTVIERLLIQVSALFADYCAIDLLPALAEYKGSAKIHILRAGRNSSWTPDVISSVERIATSGGKVQFHLMPNVRFIVISFHLVSS